MPNRKGYNYRKVRKEKSHQHDLKYREKHREEMRQRQRDYRQRKKEQCAKTDSDYKNNYPERVVAGIIARKQNPHLKPCEVCGSTDKVIRHHPDYNEPNKIVFLCGSCHKKEHLSLREALSK
jgi:hypothetical protein